MFCMLVLYASAVCFLTDIFNVLSPTLYDAADPTAPEVLRADRLVAAAARKAVAMHRAFEATKALQALPQSVSQDGEQQKQQQADAA
jgi:hypothetical protein